MLRLKLELLQSFNLAVLCEIKKLLMSNEAGMAMLFTGIRH